MPALLRPHFARSRRFLRLFHAAAQPAVDAGAMTMPPDQAAELIYCALHGVTAGLIGMPEHNWGPPMALAGRMMDTLRAGLLRGGQAMRI